MATAVDQTLGEGIASSVLGYDTTTGALGSGFAAAVFAFVTGITGNAPGGLLVPPRSVLLRDRLVAEASVVSRRASGDGRTWSDDR
jgi:hypothetical protein